MKKYYFNWRELRRDSDDNFDAILCLTYCLIIGYNKTIVKQSRDLFRKLNINQIPQSLFRKKHLYFYKGKIISLYKCDDIQSYFINPDFCVCNVPIKQKIEYLYLLSHRRISESEHYIPKDYVSEKHYNNIFVTTDKNKIYFKPEITKQRGMK